tara:strand:- start:263 stop:499 length:237 start_codon:yes stop_codon:yes gene_type:complete
LAAWFLVAVSGWFLTVVSGEVNLETIDAARRSGLVARMAAAPVVFSAVGLIFSRCSASLDPSLHREFALGELSWCGEI